MLVSKHDLRDDSMVTTGDDTNDNSSQVTKYNLQIEQTITLLKEKYALGFKTVISP